MAEDIKNNLQRRQFWLLEDAIRLLHCAVDQAAMMTGVETSPRKDRYGITSLALTWAGQKFSDNILNDGVWASARKTLVDAELKSASFEILPQFVVAKITELCSSG